MNNKPSIKRKLFFALTFTISLCLTLLLGEILVRIISPQQEAMRWFKTDKRYGYLLKKNFHQNYHFTGHEFVMNVETNSMGHRSKEYDRSAFIDPNIKKILLIGDSFTFGHGVNMEDHFGTLLEALLNKKGINNLVINAGIGGWGTLQSVAYAKDNFALFNPDIIVYTFDGHDPEDDIRFKKKLADHEKGVLYFPGKIFLRNHSHLYRLFLYKYYQLANYIHIKKKAAELDQNFEINEQCSYLTTEEEFNRTIQYIKNFHRDFLRFNPDGVLLIQTTAPWDTNIREHLKRISNGKDLIYVDLYEATVSLPAEQRRLEHDAHWGKNVHSISADYLHKNVLNVNNE